MLGLWTKSFDRYFLNVGESGELLLAATNPGKKKSHIVLVFREENGALVEGWARMGVGDLSGPPSMTKEGLTLFYESPSQEVDRFTPANKLPKKGGNGLGFKDIF